ncbi:MAG: hypothetical protein J5I93_11285 [Pirellulaceae bacterium]|nr:hypothetical protein [Pirellulaceae bacterium]
MASTTRAPRAREPKASKRQKTAFTPRENWQEWVQHLAARREPQTLRRLIGEQIDQRVRQPLAWGLPTDTPAETTRLLDQLDRVTRGKPRSGFQAAVEAESWLAALATRPADHVLAWEALAWTGALPSLAESLSADSWNDLLDALLQLADDARREPLLKPDSNLLVHQLLAGELPLTLAGQLPELPACRRLAGPARKLLTLGICEALDGEGLPHASNLARLRPLLACWIRCRVLDPKCFNSEARTQLEWLARQAIRLCRPDGSQLLSELEQSDWCGPLFKTLLQVAGDAADRSAAARWLRLEAGQSGKSGKRKLPDPTVYSAWSELAVLRSDWAPRSTYLAVAFDRPRMRCEVGSDRQSWLGGDWETDFLVDGQAVDQASVWEEVCWFSDEDVDYLELERPLSDQWRVQRQMLLARRDGFVLLCDALLGERPAELSCRSRIPLADEPRVYPAKQTRELLLRTETGMARCLPLALPEWRIQPASGELCADARQLCWETSGRGRNLFHPLLLDLDRQRMDKECTWRRLTIGEQRQIQAADVAVGYRIQIGKKQWMLYRSLAAAANRTLLGQNYSNEFVLARFTRDGTCEPLIEIESA